MFGFMHHHVQNWVDVSIMRVVYNEVMLWQEIDCRKYMLKKPMIFD